MIIAFLLIRAGGAARSCLCPAAISPGFFFAIRMKTITIITCFAAALMLAACNPSRKACEKSYGPCGRIIERTELRDTLIRIPGDTVRVAIPSPPQWRMDTMRVPFPVDNPVIMWRSPTVVPGEGAASLRYEWQGDRLLVECVCDTVVRLKYVQTQRTKEAAPEEQDGWVVVWIGLAVFAIGLVAGLVINRR